MYLEFQISNTRLSDLIRNGIEQNLMTRNIGFSGLLPNVPFFTNVIQLLNNEAESATVAVDHIRLTDVRLFAGTLSVSTSINVPAVFLPIPIPPRSITVNARPIRIAVTFDIHLVKQDDLIAANGNAVASVDTMIVQCKANLAIPPLAISGSTLAIAPTVVDVELGVAGIFINIPPASDRAGLGSAEQLALFRSRNRVLVRLEDETLASLYNVLLLINSPTVLGNLAIPPIPLNISGIDSVLISLTGAGGPLRIWNVGLFVDSTRAIVRLQAAPSGLFEHFLGAGAISNLWASEWAAFFANGSTSRLGANDWSLFFPAKIFLDSLHKNIVDGVAADTRIGLSAGGSPRSEWQISGGTPDTSTPCSAGSSVRVITRFAIFVPGACLPWALDVDVNVQLTITLSLRPGGTLRTDLHLDYRPDEGDLALCAIVNSHIAAAMGWIIGGALGGFVGAAITTGVLGLVGGVASIVVGYTYDPGALSLGNTLQPVPGSDRDFFVEVPIQADLSLSSARMEIAEMAACPDGLCVRGRIVVLDMELLLAGNLTGTRPFAWSGLGLCTEDALITASTYLQWDLERTRTGLANMPLMLFQFTVLDAAPPAHRTFLPSVALEHSTGMVLTATTDDDQAIRLTEDITGTDTRDSFLEVFIQTNVGTRIVRFNAFDMTLTRETFDTFAAGRQRFCALTEMGRRARRQPSPFRLLLDRYAFERKLTIRPMKGAQVMSIWTLMANEMYDGDVMRIGRTTPASEGKLEFFHDFVASDKAITARIIEYVHKDDSRLSLQLKTSSKEGILAMSWQYFYETARIPFASKCIDAVVERVDGELYLGLLTEGGVDVYNLTTSQPRLVFASLLAGMKQINWRRGALLIEGAAKTHYDLRTNRLLPDTELGQQAALGKSSARRRYRVIDDQGQWLSVEIIGRLALVQDKRQRYISIYERIDRKDPDQLYSPPPC